MQKASTLAPERTNKYLRSAESERNSFVQGKAHQSVI